MPASLPFFPMWQVPALPAAATPGGHRLRCAHLDLLQGDTACLVEPGVPSKLAGPPGTYDIRIATQAQMSLGLRPECVG